MKFFTPQLYQQFNSPDAAEAEHAYEQWEEAMRGYKRHLSEFHDRLPSQMIKLSELDLHDAEFLAFTEDSHSGLIFPDSPSPIPIPLPFWTAVAVLTVKREEEIFSLFYGLWDHVREMPAPDNWAFSKLRPHWLYEELDWVQEGRGGRFYHRILLSDGRILEVPFITVMIHHFPLPAAEATSKVRESA